MGVKTGTITSLQGELRGEVQARLLSGLARCAEDLTNGRGWPDGVDSLLETLGEITAVSRVWIFQTVELTDSYITQDYVFEWASAPQYAQIENTSFSMFRTPIDNNDYRAMIESRKRGEWQKVLTSTLQDSPLKQGLIQQRIKSMLTIPILVEDQWWGVLGFDDCEREFEWNDSEISLLRTATFLISNAIIRDRLSAIRKQLDILQTSTESSAWEYNFKKGHFWSTPSIINSLPGPSNNIRLSMRGALALVYQKDRRKLLDAINLFLKGNDPTFRHDLRLYSQCGEIRWVELIGTVGRDSEGNPEQIAGIAIDIIKRKAHEKKLEQQATTDHLTGAVNRSVFERKLRETLRNAMKNGTSLSLLMLDIDHFKLINDTWGHDVGDLVLREFTKLCDSNLRATDVLARIGGEEFAILLPETDRKMAAVIGERIRTAIEEKKFKGPDHTVSITTSVGCTSCNGKIKTTPEILCKTADHALYTAKRTGRNLFVYQSSLVGDCALEH